MSNRKKKKVTRSQMAPGLKKLLRVRCYYCDELAVLDVAKLDGPDHHFGDHSVVMKSQLDKVKDILEGQGWLLAIMPTEDRKGFCFDPLCHDCGRDVVKQIIEDGGQRLAIDPETKERFQKLYPDLFTEEDHEQDEEESN